MSDTSRRKNWSAGMVRLFRAQQFKGQAVFSSDGEPVALACSDEWLFIATARCQIEVHPLLSGLEDDLDGGDSSTDCSTVSYKFQTVSPVISMAHNTRVDCIATLEKHRQKRKNVTAARVYFNWKHGNLKQAARILLAGGPEGIPVSPSSYGDLGMSGQAARLSVVELPCPGHASCISCCPRTGSMAVGGGTKVRVFVLGLRGLSSSQSYSVEHLLDVDVGCTVTSVALCENYLAVMSARDVRVMYIDVATALAVTLIPPALSQQARARGADADTAMQVWRSAAAMVDTDDVIELTATRSETGKRDETERAREVLGPVRTVWGRPVEVEMAASFSSSDSSSTAGDSAARIRKGGITTLLYRQFSADEVRDGLHSLQLLPVYDERRVAVDPISGGRMTDPRLAGSIGDAEDDDEDVVDDNRWLAGMYCFFSTPRQGYQYSVLLCSPTALVTTYPYVSETKAVSISGPLLQAITTTGLETYSLRTFTDAAARAFPCSGYPYGNRRESTVSNSRKRSRAQREVERAKRIPKLAEFCPAHGDICVLGMNPFYSLCHVEARDSCLVLLSKAEGDPEKARETAKDHAFTRSISLFLPGRRDTPEADCGSWSVYVLHYVPVSELYSNLSLLAEKHKFMSAPVYGELLSEAGVILRSRLLSLSLQLPPRPLDLAMELQALSGVVDDPVIKAKEKERTDLCALLFECNGLLGDLCCRPDFAHPEWAPYYYRMAALSIAEIVSHAVKQAAELEMEGRHKSCFGLGTVLSLEKWMSAATPRYMAELPESVANDIFRIYSAVHPDQLSFLVLESGLASYSNEIAVQCIYDYVKSSSQKRLSAKDAFALCVLHLRLAEVEEARTVLKNVKQHELLQVCFERQSCMLEGDQLSHIAQLLRQHTPDILLDVLVGVHASGTMSTATILSTLGMDGSGSNLAGNKHARYFLEAVLSDDAQTHSYEVAAGLACKIYLERFQHCLSMKQVTGNAQAPSGGHFARRYEWLNMLPPFTCGTQVTCSLSYHVASSSTSAAGSSPVLRLTRSSSPLAQLLLKSRNATAAVAAATGDRVASVQHPRECTCAFIDLVSIQSLLCWRAVSRQLASSLLQQLQAQDAPAPPMTSSTSSSPGRSGSPSFLSWSDNAVMEAAWLSLQAVCCLRLDRHVVAAQLLLKSYPHVSLALAKAHFGADSGKWRSLMQKLLALCNQHDQQQQQQQ
eukprot:scpid24836/ scgid25879/ Hermansky-Pudlak syndrome 3 protein homolog; Cocoa protein